MTYDKQKEVCCIVSRNFHYWKRLHSCNKFMENQWKGNGHKQRTPLRGEQIQAKSKWRTHLQR